MEDDFYLVRIIARLSRDEAAALCGTSCRTIKHWEKTTAPIHALNIIKMAAGFPWCENWDGWRFYNGALFSPEGIEYHPGEICAIPYLHAQIYELRSSRQTSAQQHDYRNVIPFPILDHS